MVLPRAGHLRALSHTANEANDKDPPGIRDGLIDRTSRAGKAPSEASREPTKQSHDDPGFVDEAD